MSENGSIFLPAMGRGNGLAPEAPRPGQTILVAGGAGYIGCVLIAAAARARLPACACSTACTWASEPLGGRARPDRARRRRRARHPRRPRSTASTASSTSPASRNDPTAEYDPEANWQMNAIATETLGRDVRRARHRALRVRLLVLALRRPAARACTTRPPPIQPRGAYATSKRYGEEALLELVDDGPVPGASCATAPSTATARGCASTSWSTRSSRTRCSTASCSLHGGGWMWRPLVDVRDVRRRDDRRLRGARREGPRRDLQRPALELPDPRAGDARRRLGAARCGRSVELERGPGAEARRATTSARTRSSRRRSASSRATRCVEAVTDMLDRDRRRATTPS